MLNITLCRKEKRGGFYLQYERKPLPCLECRLGGRNAMTGMIVMDDVIMNGLKSLPFDIPWVQVMLLGPVGIDHRDVDFFACTSQAALHCGLPDDHFCE